MRNLRTIISFVRFSFKRWRFNVRIMKTMGIIILVVLAAGCSSTTPTAASVNTPAYVYYQQPPQDSVIYYDSTGRGKNIKIQESPGYTHLKNGDNINYIDKWDQASINKYDYGLDTTASQPCVWHPPLKLDKGLSQTGDMCSIR